jgi:hypothetical protein
MLLTPEVIPPGNKKCDNGEIISGLMRIFSGNPET